MHPDIIASYELIAHKGSESPYPVRVLLRKPIQSKRMAPAWSCEVTVEPLWSNPFEIYGEGSFQALCLGAKHALQMLATFIEQGGVLENREGEAFDPEVFGFRLLPPIGEAGDA
jgi:hypothetical protein